MFCFKRVNQQIPFRLIEYELEKLYQKGFLENVAKKLSNERFVQNAKPEVVALEQQKQADAIARIATIEESLQSL